MKIAGIVFIVLSAFSAGVRISGGLKSRCNDLRRFLNALQVFENEISFAATPLPEAFAAMAETLQGRGKEIIAFVSAQMRTQRWTTPRTATERALERFPDSQIGEVLLELSSNLGKYDLPAQLHGIEQARQRVKALLCTVEEERLVKSKTYRTLCICAGLATAILLI